MILEKLLYIQTAINETTDIDLNDAINAVQDPTSIISSLGSYGTIGVIIAIVIGIGYSMLKGKSTRKDEDKERFQVQKQAVKEVKETSKELNKESEKIDKEVKKLDKEIAKVSTDINKTLIEDVKKIDDFIKKDNTIKQIDKHRDKQKDKLKNILNEKD